MSISTASRRLANTSHTDGALATPRHEASRGFDPEAYRACASRIHLPNAERILSNVPFAGNEKILDIGCGEGTVTVRALIPKIPRGMVIGIDNDACMVALAARTCREPAFQEADVRSMKETFRKHDLSLLFDIVFSNFALHGLADAANHRRALQNIRDMMSPGGIAVISFLDSKGFGEFHEAAHLVSQRAEWSGKFTTRSSRDFLSFDTFKSLALKEGFRGEVTRTETWVSFEDAAELKGCFMTLWRNYMSCLPDQTQQEAFADAVVNYYQTIVRNINDYPSERGGLSIRQSTIDAHLLHGTFTNS